MIDAEDPVDESSAGPPSASFRSAGEAPITTKDLYELKLWRESEPDAPDGPWFKDFGSFKICGEGKFSETFLLKGQAAKGKPL